MQLQRVNNQPSFQAKLVIIGSDKANRITPRQECQLAKIARGIGTELDEIILDIGPVIEDLVPAGFKIKHYMIYGAIKRVGSPLTTIKTGSLVKSHESLKNPFDAIRDLLTQLKKPSLQASTLAPAAMAKARKLAGR